MSEETWSERAYREDCEHPIFEAKVEVNRVEDVGKFSADVTINCAKCGSPFVFLGMKFGVSLSIPLVSLDGTEARLPIAPADSIHTAEELQSGIYGNTTPHPE